LSPVFVGIDKQDRLIVSTRETAMKTGITKGCRDHPVRI
jgi:hypothetical protein